MNPAKANPLGKTSAKAPLSLSPEEYQARLSSIYDRLGNLESSIRQYIEQEKMEGLRPTLPRDEFEKQMKAKGFVDVESSAQRVRDVMMMGKGKESRPLWEKIMEMRGEMIESAYPPGIKDKVIDYQGRIPYREEYKDLPAYKRTLDKVFQAFKVANNPNSSDKAYRKAHKELHDAMSLYAGEYLDFGAMADASVEIFDELDGDRTKALRSAFLKSLSPSLRTLLTDLEEEPEKYDDVRKDIEDMMYKIKKDKGKDEIDIGDLDNLFTALDIDWSEIEGEEDLERSGSFDIEDEDDETPRYIKRAVFEKRIEPDWDLPYAVLERTTYETEWEKVKNEDTDEWEYDENDDIEDYYPSTEYFLVRKE